jgi:hypothetical protein
LRTLLRKLQISGKVYRSATSFHVLQMAGPAIQTMYLPTKNFFQEYGGDIYKYFKKKRKNESLRICHRSSA